MKFDLLKHAGAVAAAGAVLFGAGAAGAVVYDFNLTGVVSNGAYSSFGGTSFYDLDLVVDGDFEPFELVVGDTINLTVSLDQLLGVPAATGVTFFGVDVLTSQRFGNPPADGATGSGSVTFGDGVLAGNTYSAACTNCLAGTAILSPGPAFSVSQFTASITVENLFNLDPDDTTPFFANGFQLRYQVSDQAGVVPEPATWAMMIMGFGATGAIVRRRRLAAA